jgi:hypothetical protein
MNRQLSALSDAQLAAFDGGDDLAPDVPTQEPTPEQYQAALVRLRAWRSTTIDGGTGLPDVNVEFHEFTTVTMWQEGQFIQLSPAMLQAAADWVAQQ